MHVYSMQPMLDTFNKAGTFGYAYALLPLLTCRRSRVGQQKKKGNPIDLWVIRKNLVLSPFFSRTNVQVASILIDLLAA